MSDTPDLLARTQALGVQCEPAALNGLLRYLDAMLAKNQVLNLTGVRDPEAAEVLHVLDSLALGLVDLEVTRAADLGSGNGFPGVAIHALHPAAQTTLIERTAKKARALEELVAAAALPRTEVLCADAAQVPGLHPALRGSFDLITARALGDPAKVAQLAEHLIAPGGHLVLWLAEGTEAPDAVDEFARIEVVEYELPAPVERVRQLAVYC